jgi:hypothetical protein
VPGTWTVTAVPEPANWVVMLVGFAGMGAMMRRRRAFAVNLRAATLSPRLRLRDPA